MRLRPLLLPLTGIIALAVGLVAVGDLNGNLVYYLTPDEAVERRAEFTEDRRFRLAGDVGGEEVRRSEHGASFTVTGTDVDVAVVHAGVVPHLFQAGIPVVVEGSWQGEVFRSDTMLIKHDEEYYPADEADEVLPGPMLPDAAGHFPLRLAAR